MMQKVQKPHPSAGLRHARRGKRLHVLTWCKHLWGSQHPHYPAEWACSSMVCLAPCSGSA